MYLSIFLSCAPTCLCVVSLPSKPHCPPWAWMHTWGNPCEMGRPCVLWWGDLSQSGPRWQLDTPCTTSTGPQRFTGAGRTASNKQHPSCGGLCQADERTKAFWAALGYAYVYWHLKRVTFNLAQKIFLFFPPPSFQFCWHAPIVPFSSVPRPQLPRFLIPLCTFVTLMGLILLSFLLSKKLGE